MDQLNLFAFADYDRLLIGGRPFITGRPNFWPSYFHGLNPGMRVSQVGKPGRNGKPTSAHRVDTWKPWIEYMGMIFIDDFGADDRSAKCIAFKLPPDGLIDNSTQMAVVAPYYVLYGIAGDELIIPNYQRNSIEIFKPHFILCQ